MMDMQIWPDWVARGILPDIDQFVDFDQLAVIVHLKMPLLNTNRCRFPLIQAAECDDPEVTPEPSQPNGLYLMLDSGPKNEYNKRKEGIKHSGYVFGRGPLTDVPFDAKAKNLSRNHLLLRLRRGTWILENLSASAVGVNQGNLENRVFLALNPQVPNVIRCPGDLTFYIYCCDPRRLDYKEQLYDTTDFPLMSTLDLESSVSSTQISVNQTTQNTVRETTESDRAPVLYVLQDNPILLYNSRLAYIALDPWICEFKVAKVVPPAREEQLRHQIQLLEQLPDHERIIRNSSILQVDSNLVAVNPWRRVASLLDEMQYTRDYEDSDREIFRSAIGLLHGGLSLLGFLHKHGFAHRDISLNTILVTSYQPSPDDVFLAGFSESKPVTVKTKKLAYAEDCLALFQCVRDFIHSFDRPSLLSGIHWLEHPALQDAWRLFERPEGRSISALDLCDELGLRFDHNSIPWKDVFLPVRREIEIRQDSSGLRLLNYTDMTKLVNLEVRSCRMPHEGRVWVTSCRKTYFEANQHEGFFPEKDFWKFDKKVKESINTYWGLGLVFSFAKNTNRHQIYADCSIRIPCYRPSRLFNLSELLRICEPDNLAKLQSLYHSMSGLQDIRGVDSLQGIYVPFDVLEMIAPELRLDISDIQRQISPYTGKSCELDSYDIQSWIMLASGESSHLVPLHRATKEVAYHGQNIAIGPFLRKYGPKLALNVLNHTALSVPNFYKIRLPSSISQKSVTYEDTVESRRSFSFKPRLREPSDAKQRTVDWLGSSNSSRVNKKKAKLTLKE